MNYNTLMLYKVHICPKELYRQIIITIKRKISKINIEKKSVKKGKKIF